MAKPIKETPILYGKDAENFLREIGELDEKPDVTPVDSQSASSVSFSIEEIKHYLKGVCLVGEHKENDMLKCAISLLDDYEDGIEAVTERMRTR